MDKNAKKWFDLANQESEKGNTRKSIEYYSKAISIKPDYVSAYYNRAQDYDSLGEYEHAIQDYTRVIKLNPSDHEAYYNRGLSFRKLKDYHKQSMIIQKRLNFILII